MKKLWRINPFGNGPKSIPTDTKPITDRECGSLTNSSGNGSKPSMCSLWVILAIWIVVAGSGCTNTVAPHLAASAQASFDQGGQNSGILSVNPDHSLVVTPRLRDRYNALALVYAQSFQPPLALDQGLTPTATNTFVMSPQAFEHFATMNRWRKQGPPAWFKTP